MPLNGSKHKTATSSDINKYIWRLNQAINSFPWENTEKKHGESFARTVLNESANRTASLRGKHVLSMTIYLTKEGFV